jgi:dihydrolipoamide dehydrogenase
MVSKEKAVGGLTQGIEYLFKKNNVDYIKGWGKFAGPHDIDVDLTEGGSETVSAKNVIIATGSEPNALPAGVLDIDERYVVTSTGALSLPEVPKSMVVVGGGVIGLEMASVYARLGTEVTVVQHTDRICPFLDKEVSSNFLRVLKK